MDATTSAAGHAVGRDGGGLVVEAWAASRSACLEQLVRGVVCTFAEPRPEFATREIHFELDAALDEDLVVTLLEDVLYLARADDLAVVDVVLEEDEETGSIEGTFVVAPVPDLPATGACPTRVARSSVSLHRDESVWRAGVRLQS
jgi:SHS2 domain-containing protein